MTERASEQQYAATNGNRAYPATDQAVEGDVALGEMGGQLVFPELLFAEASSEKPTIIPRGFEFDHEGTGELRFPKLQVDSPIPQTHFRT